MSVMNENAGAGPGCLSCFYFVDYLHSGPSNRSCTLRSGLMATMMTTAIFSLVDSHPACFAERSEPKVGSQISAMWCVAFQHFQHGVLMLR